MTREEAIARIELAATEMTGTLADTTEQSAAEVLQRYIDAYDMAIAALREQPQWISVEERLPERGEVIAFSKQYGDYLLGWLATTETNGVVCYGDGCEMYCVTHWMPLPEPPKEEV